MQSAAGLVLQGTVESPEGAGPPLDWADLLWEGQTFWESGETF